MKLVLVGLVVVVVIVLGGVWLVGGSEPQVSGTDVVSSTTEGFVGGVVSSSSPVPDSTMGSATTTTVAPVEDVLVGMLESVSANPNVLDGLIAPEMVGAVDLAGALPEGASIVPNAGSLVVVGSSAAMFASVVLPSGATDEFLVVFARVDDEWLLASTLRLGDR